MATVKYSATVLKALGKEGVAKPDENGYYELILGGLNMFNSAGEYYVLEGAKSLFESSSALMRRISTGNLKGEVGHPKPLPGMTKDEYMARIMRIEETNICCHISDVWLDENFGKKNPRYNNPKMVAVIGKVKPAGVRGEALKEALENKMENVCFSVRAVTEDYYVKGINNRVLRAIFTWDWVNEPGIFTATKYASPATEARSTAVALESIDGRILTKESMERIVESPEIFALENDKQFAREVLSICKGPDYERNPHYAKW